MSQWLTPPLKVLCLLMVIFLRTVPIFSYDHNPHHEFYFKNPKNNFIFADYHHHQGFSHYGNQAPPPKVPPQQVMIDLVNDLGLTLLAIHNENNENNIAISPYGALSVLVALAEGVVGVATDEIHQCAHIPYNIPLVRVGLRDIHRHLKSYFIPEEGFLGGLTFSNDNVTLRPQYEEILRFYGFDVETFNNALMPDALFSDNANKTISVSTTMVPSMRDETENGTTESTATGSTKEMDSNTAETTLVTTEIPTISTIVPISTTSTTTEEMVTNLPTSTIDLPTTTDLPRTSSPTSTTISSTTTSSTTISSTTKVPTTITDSSITQKETSTTEISTSTQSETTTKLSTTQTESTITIPSNSTTTQISTTTETINTQSTESSTSTTIPSTTNSSPFPESQTKSSTSTSSTTFVITTNEESTSTPDYLTSTITPIPTESTIPSSSETTITTNVVLSTTEGTTVLYENITLPIFSVATPPNSFSAEIEETTIYNAEGTTNIGVDESSTIANFDYTNEESTFYDDLSVTTENPSTVYYDELSTTSTADYADNFAFNSVNDINSGTTSNNNFQRRKRDLSRNYVAFNNKHDLDHKQRLSKRKTRSLVDYLIARYYDDHPDQYHYNNNNYQPDIPYITNEQPSFLIYGKYREYKVDFMKYDTVLPFYYVPHLDALALSFPLDSAKYYLLLLLPVNENGIDKLVCDLRLHSSLKFIIENLRYHHVRALIPSFMLKGFVNLTPTLQKLGIRRVFEPRQADFSPMTDEKDIYVKNIEQAVTVTIRNYMNPMTMQPFRNLHQMHPVLFRADHPFLYFVIDSDLHVTLMAGKIVNPLNSRII